MAQIPLDCSSDKILLPTAQVAVDDRPDQKVLADELRKDSQATPIPKYECGRPA